MESTEQFALDHRKLTFGSIFARYHHNVKIFDQPFAVEAEYFSDAAFKFISLGGELIYFCRDRNADPARGFLRALQNQQEVL